MFSILFHSYCRELLNKSIKERSEGFEVHELTLFGMLEADLREEIFKTVEVELAESINVVVELLGDNFDSCMKGSGYCTNCLHGRDIRLPLTYNITIPLFIPPYSLDFHKE